LGSIFIGAYRTIVWSRRGPTDTSEIFTPVSFSIASTYLTVLGGSCLNFFAPEIGAFHP
jgi:hypothetical protein